MSDKILNALMQLFAIIANSDRLTAQGRSIVELFLQQQLSHSTAAEYLLIYDKYLDFLRGKDKAGQKKKRVSVNSVKILRICTDINTELDLRQKYIVIIRLLEFVFSSEGEVTEQEVDFLNTVADVFNINKAEYDACYALIASKVTPNNLDSPYLTLLTGSAGDTRSKVIVESGFEGHVFFLYFEEANILLAKYYGSDTVRLNSQPITSGIVYIIPPGSVVRGSKANPVYFNDIIRAYFNEKAAEPIYFTAKSLEYEFRNGKKGLHNFSFSASSGELVGIMGGSGAGKSTLLNLLNGNYSPSKGSVDINGVSIHKDKSKLEGIVGYVPQDDLLIDDLTVYQNLFYNSKLCFGKKNDTEIDAIVTETIDSLGLMEIKDLKVGNVFNKTISGGQRKRLNIALELVRKPSVLFVDEPTSGLSSLDSENVMDLMKELSVSGKLIFIVIHQPSSDIFKLFDQLILLDIGGYPVYFGNPSDSLSYFKTIAGHVDANINECIECGNINPDLIFSILEAHVVDEFGHLTSTRKITPAEWYEHYKNHTGNRESTKIQGSIPEIDYKKPSKIKQLGVFFTRDLLSKIKNTQYMLINFLEAPVLAVILAYFLKYYNTETGYVFSENLNLPAYLFMCVIVALFIGLTVSAEEIIRDRKIQTRELFLNLSRSSYLLSKVLLLFLLSAIQTASFVIIGNTILEINDMYFNYFVVLFAISCFSNILGLNISSAFNSAVTIYILIPFLIIPQIILSGVIVKFNNLNPSVTSQKHVPLIGEIMASRWAFEALAVKQFTSNGYEKNFFDNDVVLNDALFKKDFWVIHMTDLLDSIKKKPGNSEFKKLFVNEFLKEIEANKTLSFNGDINTIINKNTSAGYDNIKIHLNNIRKYYINTYKNSRAKKDDIVSTLEIKLGAEGLTELKKTNTNKSVTDLVTNAGDFNYMVEHEGEYYRRFRPIYMSGSASSFIRAPFYVSKKNVIKDLYSTYSINLFVIWGMTLLLYLTLYFNILKKGIQLIERISEKAVKLISK
jgi:ABC-type multidrug transport system ATPase subunit